MNDNRLLDVLTREGVLLDVSVRLWRAAKNLRVQDLGARPRRCAEASAPPTSPRCPRKPSRRPGAMRA